LHSIARDGDLVAEEFELLPHHLLGNRVIFNE
jgi:hypothetical protein